MKGNSGFQIGTGVTSILMIFVVLCLTTFAILSYTSADADLELSKEHTGYIEAYYKTYSELNDELAKMDETFYQMMLENEDGSYGYQRIVMAFQIMQSEDIVASYSQNLHYINVSMSKEINDKQKLVMEVSFDTSGTEKRCRVEKCYVYSENGNTTQEETLPGMWGG